MRAPLAVCLVCALASAVPAELPAGAAGSAEIALGIAPTRPVPARSPDEQRLAQARRLLGDGAAGRLGPYLLWTDVRDAERLAFLDRVAARFEESHRGRYGRAPVGSPAEAVVLFAEEADYRTFQEQEEGLARRDARGHSSRGIVALWDGGRPRIDLAATLVHELAHLVNRRALGPLLPSWLDEGIADDLAQSELDEEGRIRPGTLSGVRVKAGRSYRVFGAQAMLLALAQEIEQDRLPPLPRLLDLSWDEFLGSEGGLHYIHAAFWIRYLLDGEGGAHAPAFHAFLDAVAAGGPATGEALRERLGRPWEELEKGFHAWVLSQTEEDRGRGAPVTVASPAAN
jgi:hypothetical protein